MRLMYVFHKGTNLIITDSVTAKLLKYRQTKIWHKEAGGLLIGRHLIENDDLVVDQITEPTRWDRRFRGFFFRSHKHSKLVHKAWKNSDKTQTLIGLWHTHPEKIPHPSSVDYEDWEKTLYHGDFVGDYLVFMIVGIQQIRLWQGDRGGQFLELSRPMSTK
jgi:integrative and conjugative element protein (TIGR02256 family)